jgi:transposase
MQVREAKAIELVERGRVLRDASGFLVFSLNNPNRYRVVLAPRPHCDCDDFELRQEPCKHVLAAQIMASREGSAYNPETVTDEPPHVWKKPSYPQAWAKYDDAQTNEKDHFLELLSDLCSRLREPAPTKGRPRVSVRDGIFSTIYKVYVGFSGRRFASDLREATRDGYVSRAINHSSIARCLEDAETTPVLLGLITESSLPLQAMEKTFAVDSTGFSGCRYDRWYSHKWGRMESKAVWTKAHVIAGTETHVVTAVEIEDQNSHDYPQFGPLVKKTAEHFTIHEVCADKAYVGRENFQIVQDCGGTAYLAFKYNATGSVGGIYERMYHLFCMNKEDYLRRYHRRSNIESVFSAVKRVLGDSVRSKNATAMKNEVLAKLVCHNICCLIHAMYELGIDLDLRRALTAEEEPAVLRMVDYR